MRTYNRKDVFSLVNAEEAEQYVGKNGYFADSFTYLDDRVKSDKSFTLIGIDLKNVACFNRDGNYFGLFLPCDKVIEGQPKYRAYKNVAEFLSVYDIGDVITIRYKYDDEPAEIIRAMVTGIEGDNIIIGMWQYTLQELFENYEVELEGEWYPIGVLED